MTVSVSRSAGFTPLVHVLVSNVRALEKLGQTGVNIHLRGQSNVKIYWSVSVESVQKTTRLTGKSVSHIIILYRQAPVTAALSSKQDNITVLMGASFDFDILNRHVYP